MMKMIDQTRDEARTVAMLRAIARLQVSERSRRPRH